MSRATYFVQECPTCGRQLQIRVEYLGRQLVCEHCRGAFQASDPSQRPAARAAGSMDLLERVDELLAAVDSTLPRPR